MLKISTGRLRKKKLLSPKAASGIRPTQAIVKEALINTLRSYLPLIEQSWENLNALDLFAGSGAVGLELLSNAAGFVTFVESETDCLKTIKNNIQTLGLNKETKVIAGRLPLILKKIKQKPFNLVFLDPPYLDRDKDSKAVWETINKLISESFISKNGLLILEYNDISCEKALSESFSEALEKLKTKRFGDSFLFFYKFIG
jgi:16S rRNA (guanine966-N2)-methyltransferase